LDESLCANQIRPAWLGPLPLPSLGLQAERHRGSVEDRVMRHASILEKDFIAADAIALIAGFGQAPK
jgi:hypothetical protein